MSPDLTPESEEMLSQMRWVIERLREMDHPDQMGKPIDQSQARGQLALIEEAAGLRARVAVGRRAERSRSLVKQALELDCGEKGTKLCLDGTDIHVLLWAALTDDQEGET